MSYPSSGSGYPQGGPQNQPRPDAGGFGSLNLIVVLSLFVTLLGLVTYFVAFANEAEGSRDFLQLLLAGGLLAAVRLLPNGPRVLPFVALLSTMGALFGLLTIVRVPTGVDVPSIITVMFILGIVQMLVSIGALLLDYNLIKPPAPRPQQPYGQQQYAQPQQQYGQQQRAAGEQPPATQYGPPAGQQQSPPAAQPTQYASTQGQFFQQQQSQEPGEQSPGTPPGGTKKP